VLPEAQFRDHRVGIAGCLVVLLKLDARLRVPAQLLPEARKASGQGNEGAQYRFLADLHVDEGVRLLNGT
jgi:hypothetical protein